MSDFEVIVSYVHPCVPMEPIQMTARTQGDYIEAFHTETFRKEAFAQRSSYTQKSLHREVFYTEELLHTEASRSFYTEEL